MNDTATFEPTFYCIESDMLAVDELFHERAQSRLTVLNNASFHILARKENDCGRQ